MHQLPHVLIFIHYCFTNLQTGLLLVFKFICVNDVFYPLSKTEDSTVILFSGFSFVEVKTNYQVQKPVVSPKSLFHLTYILRVPGLTLGLMRFRESSKSFLLMLRISLAAILRTWSGPNSVRGFSHEKEAGSAHSRG